jgi:excisionase family DNA binding protein
MTESTISENAPTFLTTGQFAQRANLSQATVKRLCDSGRLAHVLLSRRGDRRIPASELDRLLTEAETNRLREGLT